MREDLPTLGMPTIIMRIGWPPIPFSARRASCAESALFTSGRNAPRPLPLRQSVAMAGTPFRA